MSSTLNQQRCCIVGGGGYFGQHIAREMQAEGYHTVLLDLSFTEVDRDGFVLDEKKITRIKGSVMDEPLLEKALKKCSVCFHIAAYGMSGPAALDGAKTFEINVQGTILLLAICARIHCKRVVFASSVGVIFTDEPIEMADEDHPKPSSYYSYYSESKADAEEFVLKVNGKGLNTVALRFRGIFGAGEPRSTQRAAEAIAQGLYFARFEKTSPALTQFSGVDNTAKACALAAKALFDKPEVVGGKVYNIVDGGEPVDSWQFWNPLIATLGRKPPSWRIPYGLVHGCVSAMEVFYSVTKRLAPMVNRLEINLMAVTNTYSIERARRDLGYNPTNNHDLTEVCAYYKRYFEKHPQPFYDIPKMVIVAFSVLVLLLVVFLAWIF